MIYDKLYSLCNVCNTHQFEEHPSHQLFYSIHFPYFEDSYLVSWNALTPSLTNVFFSCLQQVSSLTQLKPITFSGSLSLLIHANVVYDTMEWCSYVPFSKEYWLLDNTSVCFWNHQPVTTLSAHSYTIFVRYFDLRPYDFDAKLHHTRYD